MNILLDFVNSSAVWGVLLTSAAFALGTAINRCKGIGTGTSSHAIGTSKALEMGEVEGAMSGLAIAVAGVLTAVLCPVFANFI